MARPKGVKNRNVAAVDSATTAMIFDGLTKSQMTDLFKMDIRTLNRRLSVSDVEPSGQRNGYDIYQVRDVAPWVLTPKMDVEAYIKNMNPQDLPKMLSKEFWNGLKARQDYRLRENDLWETSEVHACLSEMVQVMVMSSRTIEDQVDRLAELSPKQREIFRSSIRSLMDSLRETALAHFKERRETKEEEDRKKREGEDSFDEDGDQEPDDDLDGEDL